MSVLFPAMLAGVVGLAGPVLLHLIARHRFPVQPFPSIRFLRIERRTNVFAWKLIDVPQLILRLMVLLLLVLAMSRLFVSWPSSRRAPRNLVVAVDASASMRAMARSDEGQAPLIERARAVARSLLEEIEPPSRCALVSAAASTEVLRGLGPDPGEAIEALATVAPCDGTGPGLVNAVAEACEMVRGRREVKSQVVVVTDMRASAFAVRTQRDLARIRRARDRLGEALEIVIVNVADEAVRNVAVVDAYRKGKEVRVGDDAHVIARILNGGGEEVEVAPRLAVGGSTAPAPRARPVPPGGEIVMDLTARMNRVAYSFAEVRLKETDALLDDNVRRLPLRVDDARRVLIVNGAARMPRPGARGLGGLTGGNGDEAEPEEEVIDGATILRYVLNPGRELGLAYGTGIAPTLIAPDALAAQTLSKYDVVFLYDVSSLPEKAMADLDAFVRQGRAVAIVASAGVKAMRFNRTLASGTTGRGALSPAQVGNDIELAGTAGIAPEATAHPLLAAFGDRRRGDLSVVRFARVREVRGMAGDARVMFADEAGHPLAVERQVERGRVVLFTFGLELSRGNIARTRAFPPLMWRLTEYLTGRLEPPPADTLVALRTSVVDAREPQFAFVDELELSPVAEPGAEAAPRATRVAKGETGGVLLEGMPAGQYLLHKPRRAAGPEYALGYARRLAVNVDARESDMRRAGPEDLADVFGPSLRIVAPGEGADVAPRGAELFGAVMALLLLAYAAEACLGFYLSAQREKERSAGSAS